MKKITLLAIAFVAVSFASCKKDYTCSCTTAGATTPYYTTTIHNTKSAATTACSGLQYSGESCVIS